MEKIMSLVALRMYLRLPRVGVKRQDQDQELLVCISKRKRERGVCKEYKWQPEWMKEKSKSFVRGNEKNVSRGP